MSFELRGADGLTSDALVALYESVGWTVYTRDPEALLRAVRGSSIAVTAWDGDELVGLARALSDGESIWYLQDVLVRPDRQREGIGRALVEACLEPCAHVRQKVLLTDDDPAQHRFYAALGFSDTRTLERTHLHAFVRIEGVELT